MANDHPRIDQGLQVTCLHGRLVNLPRGRTDNTPDIRMNRLPLENLRCAGNILQSPVGTSANIGLVDKHIPVMVCRVYHLQTVWLCHQGLELRGVDLIDGFIVGVRI